MSTSVQAVLSAPGSSSTRPVAVDTVELRSTVVMTRQAFFDCGLQPLDLALLQYLWFLPSAAPLTHSDLVDELQQLGWRSSNGRLIGRDAVYQSLTRLIAAGFVDRYQERSDGGQLGPVAFDVRKRPDRQQPPREVRAPQPAASAVTGYGVAFHGEDQPSKDVSPQVRTVSAEARNEPLSPTPPIPGREHPPPTLPRRTARRSRPAKRAGTGGRRREAEIGLQPPPDPTQIASAADVLASLADFRPDLHLGRTEIDGLAGLAARWLQRGASADQLRAALTSGLPARVDSAVGLLTDRLRRKMPRRRSSAPAEPTGLVPWCGTCDPVGAENPGARFIERDDGSVMPCPRCHPGQTGAASQTAPPSGHPAQQASRSVSDARWRSHAITSAGS